MCFEKKTEGGMNPMEGVQRILEQVKLAQLKMEPASHLHTCAVSHRQPPPSGFGKPGK